MFCSFLLSFQLLSASQRDELYQLIRSAEWVSFSLGSLLDFPFVQPSHGLMSIEIQQKAAGFFGLRFDAARYV